ncbi:hypothetical protein [Dactylosporangium sp. CA-233914]|uniref:hypothetical protein n=1 Tax=Dactylosporangium sp. CA-233914 TaxID=3239934 RepID=UPI003D92A70D
MRWFRRNSWVLAAASLLAGIGLLLWSWTVRDDGWLSGTLVNVGTALLLFVPLLIAGRVIEKRLDEVRASQNQIEQRQEKTAESIATLAEEVAHTQEDLRRTRDRLTEAVSSRLAASRQQDRQAFENVEEGPSHEVVFEALMRAAALHLTTESGCRVPIRNTRLYLWFETPTTHDRFQDEPDPGEDLYLRLESAGRGRVDRLYWPAEMSAEDFLVTLAEAVTRSGEYPGDASFEAGRIFSDLRELLEVVHESATSGSATPVVGAIQFFSPQWVITEAGLISVGRPGGGYSIPFTRIQEPSWPAQMAGKTWLDVNSFDNAYAVACEIAARQPKVEEMPF